jgi:hypothetical protein
LLAEPRPFNSSAERRVYEQVNRRLAGVALLVWAAILAACGDGLGAWIDVLEGA